MNSVFELKRFSRYGNYDDKSFALRQVRKVYSLHDLMRGTINLLLSIKAGQKMRLPRFFARLALFSWYL